METKCKTTGCDNSRHSMFADYCLVCAEEIDHTKCPNCVPEHWADRLKVEINNLIFCTMPEKTTIKAADKLACKIYDLMIAAGREFE